MTITRYWVSNKDDSHYESFYFNSDSERDTWIRSHGGYKYYETWNERISYGF